MRQVDDAAALRARVRARRRRRTIRRRRIVALAALAGVVLAAVVLVGRATRLDRHGAQVVRIVVTSRAVHSRRHVTVVVPPGAAPSAPRPLVVFLHGRGGDDRSSLKESMFAELRRLGRAAPVIAFPDGGDSSYWHDRASGAWARYVTDEVIPAVAQRFAADRRRVAIGGISMGGFGALDIAAHAPGRFCAVGAHSPAIWRTGGESAAGAFDDAADFARHDLVGDARRHPGDFSAQPLRIDAGDRDPFLPGDRAFVAALRAHSSRVRLRTAPGGHDGAYWSAHWPQYVDFYAAALRRCRR
jgi:S-formylglutathione hydrolase FrmB